MFLKYCTALLLSFSFLFAQAQDSDFELVNQCIAFTNYNPKNNPLEAIKSLNGSITDAEESRDVVKQMELKIEKGRINLYDLHKYEVAADMFIKVLTQEELNDNTQVEVIALCGMAQVYQQVQDNQKASEYLEKALGVVIESKNKHAEVFFTTLIAELNENRGRHDLALSQYSEVLNNKKDTHLEFAARAHAGLGRIYQSKEQYDRAETHFLDAIGVYRTLGNKLKEASMLNFFARFCDVSKQSSRALSNYKAALEMYQEFQNPEKVAHTFNEIGAHYFRNGNYERAIANLQLALREGNRVNASYVIQRAHKLLSRCYNKLGNRDMVLKSQYEHLGITEMIEHDSIENAEHINLQREKLQEIELRRTVSEKDSTIQDLEDEKEAKVKEISQKEEEIQMHRRNVLLLGAVSALAIIVVLLTFYSYLNKRRSNKKLAAANEQIAKQNEELQDLNATKDKFFSIISHDLKGPLNSLSSFTFLLKDHVDSLSKEEIQHLAADLDKSQKNLYALLENLLDWSRSQTGNIEFTPEKFDLKEVLETNKELLSAQANAKGIQINNKAEDTIEVNAHKNSVTTVVRNLISNAIKFTPESGTIDLTLKADANEVIVSVIDNGVGMTKEVMDKLFRIDAKHSTKGTADEKGTGLGLILCKEFIEKNGGRIWVTSEVDKGSQFSFSLPLS